MLNSSDKTAIIGLGNTLRRDDGIGIHVLARLQEKFGGEFSKYKETVPMFIPSPKVYESNVLNEFSWQQVKHNREYKAVIGVLLLT